jgi:hypothetical protein
MVVVILVLMILNSDFNVWDHKTSLKFHHLLTKLLYVPSQESDLSCICVLEVFMLPRSTIFILDYRIVPSVVFCVFIYLIDVVFQAKNTIRHVLKCTSVRRRD